MIYDDDNDDDEDEDEEDDKDVAIELASEFVLSKLSSVNCELISSGNLSSLFRRALLF